MDFFSNTYKFFIHVEKAMFSFISMLFFFFFLLPDWCSIQRKKKVMPFQQNILGAASMAMAGDVKCIYLSTSVRLLFSEVKAFCTTGGLNCFF